jgi:hypothetical protein
MVDKQRENAPQNPPAQGAVAVQQAQPTVENGKTKEISPTAKSLPTMSKGEKAFDDIAYKHINGTVNLVSSIAIADIFVNGKGRKGLDKAINATAKALHNSGVKSIKTAHHHSKIGWETFTLTSGGLILLAPLKWMEDNKRPIVHWLNKKMGVKQTTPDGKEKTPDEIYIEKEQPPQSWGNVIGRRILATATVIGAGLGLNHFARDKKNILPPKTYDLGEGLKVTYEARPNGGKDRVTDLVFDKIDNFSERLRGKKFVKDGVVSRWTKFAILDSVFTVITAVVMKVTNGAKKVKLPNEIDDSNDPPGHYKYPNKIEYDKPARKNFSFAEKVVRRETMPLPGRDEKDVSFVESIKHDPAPATIGI